MRPLQTAMGETNSNMEIDDGRETNGINSPRQQITRNAGDQLALYHLCFF
jgi:hypothetical protein